MENECRNNCMDWFFCLSPQQLTLLATFVALTLAEGLDTCDTGVLGNFIMSVGQLLISYAAQEECLKL